jgi:uncharacterized protein YbjT (DUF2867 family)
MAVASAPIIVVVGSTGKQGGSVIDAILAQSPPPFHIRGLTRNLESAAAKQLAARQVELVYGDLDQVDTLVAAFSGAQAVFAVTNYWEHHSAEREIQQATNIAEAARQAKVAHIVWSTLDDTRSLAPADDPRWATIPLLKGGYRVPHFDAKAAANQAFVGLPVTYLLTSCFFDNIFSPAANFVTPAPTGGLSVNIPIGADGTIPSNAVSDIGRATVAILQHPDHWIGKSTGVLGQVLTGTEYAAAIAAATGVPVSFTPIDINVFRQFGFPGADDLANMFEVFVRFPAELRAQRADHIEDVKFLDLPAFLAENPSRVAALKPATAS